MTRSVVTGSSTGIGFATALRLAQEGHEVHAAVRSTESGQPLLAASDGLDLSLMIMDIDHDESVTGAFAKVHEEHGPVDVLINNAGVAGGGAVEETPLSEFQRLMNTNTWGTLRCVQAVLPSMRERNTGQIVNVTSIAGLVVQGGQGAYVASKFATEALTETLAIEARPFGIKVAAIEPGVIKTPIFTKGSGSGRSSSPYIGSRRMSEIFRSTLKASPGTPDMVADVIWQVITAEDPALRNIVGDDAKGMAAHRATITDEQWVERQSDLDDERFRTWMSEISGVEVTALPPTT